MTGPDEEGCPAGNRPPSSVVQFDRASVAAGADDRVHVVLVVDLGETIVGCSCPGYAFTLTGAGGDVDDVVIVEHHHRLCVVAAGPEDEGDTV